MTMSKNSEHLPESGLAAAVIRDCAALIVVLDPDGRIVRFNRACERTTGYKAEEAIGKRVWDFLLTPEQVEPVKAVFADLSAGRFPNEYENYWRTKTGERRLVAWGNTAVLGAQGRVAYVIGTGIDVTEARRIEEQLAKFELGIERSGEIVFLTDADGHIFYVNPAFERIYGYLKEEVIGQTPRILKSGAHPPEHYREFWANLLAKQTVRAEIINKTKDGRFITVEASANPVLDAMGEIIGFLAIQRDITDRKRTERALQASEERLRTLMENVPEGVAVLAPDGRILYANPAVGKMLGYDSEQLVGSNVAELQHPNDRGRSAARIRLLFESGLESPSQYRLLHKDGTEVVVEVQPRVIEYEGSTALLSTMRDLTERIKLEQQLHQAQKMEAVGQLAGGIAHDFNNLLTVIQANAELAANEVEVADDDQPVPLAEIRAAVTRGKQLVEKLLAFGRGEELRIEPIDLGQLIREFLPTLRRLLPEHIEIRIETQEELPRILASKTAVEQIMMNLATNARNAMAEGGILHIGLRLTQLEMGDWLVPGQKAPGEFVTMSVSDTGTGMSEEVQARLYEPFFTTRRFGEGTGLGMAVVYGLVKQLEGHVDVFSEVGRGTTVEVALPVAAAADPPDVAAPAEAPEMPHGTETILLAEDEPSLRRAAVRSLERLGYVVLSAADGDEALELFEANADAIDLVVTDVVMPKRGGRGLYAALRERGAEVPFLFASGYTAGAVEESARLDPGLPFLSKPWSLSELAQKVREVLDTPGCSPTN
jgi:PAS domain S-box-containing protein